VNIKWYLEKDGEVIATRIADAMNSKSILTFQHLSGGIWFGEPSLGLRDRDGQEVFRGDIVVDSLGEKYEVKFGYYLYGNYSHYGFYLKYGRNIKPISPDSFSFLSVIGNIHEDRDERP
jgi:hypothetical protein